MSVVVRFYEKFNKVKKGLAVKNCVCGGGGGGGRLWMRQVFLPCSPIDFVGCPRYRVIDFFLPLPSHIVSFCPNRSYRYFRLLNYHHQKPAQNIKKQRPTHLNLKSLRSPKPQKPANPPSLHPPSLFPLFPLLPPPFPSPPFPFPSSLFHLIPSPLPPPSLLSTHLPSHPHPSIHPLSLQHPIPASSIFHFSTRVRC